MVPMCVTECALEMVTKILTDFEHRIRLIWEGKCVKRGGLKALVVPEPLKIGAETFIRSKLSQ